MMPAVYAFRPEPRTRPIVRASSTSTSSAQVLVQSCGQTDGAVRAALATMSVGMLRVIQAERHAGSQWSSGPPADMLWPLRLHARPTALAVRLVRRPALRGLRRVFRVHHPRC